MSALIEFQGFNKFFGEAQVLKGIDLSVQSGEVVVILGPVSYTHLRAHET